MPKLQLLDDVKKMVIPYGSVKKIELILGYPVEEFTEAFHINFERIQSARYVIHPPKNQYFISFISTNTIFCTIQDSKTFHRRQKFLWRSITRVLCS